MQNRGRGLEQIERELREAKAEALGRVGEQLDAALARLAALARELEALGPAPAHAQQREQLLLEWDRLRAEASRLRRHLIIQREAIGFRSHRLVDERYPLPPPRPVASAVK